MCKVEFDCVDPLEIKEQNQFDDFIILSPKIAGEKSKKGSKLYSVKISYVW